MVWRYNMPYFKWYGVDSNGMIHTGTLFSRDQQSAHAAVLSDLEITIIACQERSYTIPHYVAAREQALLFEQLSILLHAGVRVHEALQIAGSMISHTKSRLIVEDCTRAVADGMLLSEVMRLYGALFSHFTWCMIRAAEQSGTLAQTCHILAEYYQTIVTFRMKLRTILLIPMVTTTVAFIVIIGIIYGVIPQFARIMQSTNSVLPTRTTLLFSFAFWARSSLGISILLGTLIIIIGGIVWIIRTGRRSAISLFIHLPFLSSVIRDFLLARYLSALSCLLHGGVSLSRALELAIEDIPYRSIRIPLEMVVYDVIEGSTLSHAYKQHIPHLSAASYALIRVGERTGTLPKMVALCAQQYRARINYLLQMLGKFVYPCILLFLGTLVGLIALALYEPIFALGSSMTHTI